MGTRNLTMVFKNNQVVVAQYGQWDGYPSGNGVKVLDFLSRMKDDFSEKVDRVNDLLTSDYVKTRFGVDIQSLSDKDNETLFNENPQFSRDIGTKILDMIQDNEKDVFLICNKKDFAADSLFCEWAYLINLDNQTLEVYEGFNKTPLDKTDRFYELNEKAEDGYFPIKMVKSYSLLTLPTKDEFLADLTPVED